MRPEHVRLTIIKIKHLVKKLILQPYYTVTSSHLVECNLCGWKDKRFASDQWHPYIICPNCCSQIRQRLFWASVTYLDDFSAHELLNNKRILHFAPEPCLEERLSSCSPDYQTADFLAEGYSYHKIDYKINISDMPEIQDEGYDCVIAFDVLEHVPNHLNALKEIYRILRHGGICILTVPQKQDLIKTLEDLTPMEPGEREHKFGQCDHLRIYGNDFIDMLTSKGFEVTAVDASYFEKTIIEKHVLAPPILSQHPFATNSRTIFFGKKP